MDPNATYTEIQQMLINYHAGKSIDIDRLDALYSSLDTWVFNGGFKPNNYSKDVMSQAADIIESL